MPALAALSAMVSKIFRVDFGLAVDPLDPGVEDFQRRHHEIGRVEHVEHGAVGAGEPRFMMKASSASTRVAMKRSDGTRPPSAKNMSSSSTPESGSSMASALCIAFEVRPILWPLTTRPSATLISIQAFWIA